MGDFVLTVVVEYIEDDEYENDEVNNEINDEDSDSSHYPPSFVYVIKNDSMIMELSYTGSHITSDKYLALINAIKNQEKYELIYADKYEHVWIEYDNTTDMVEFHIESETCCGMSKVMIVGPQCLDCFEAVYQSLCEFEKKNVC